MKKMILLGMGLLMGSMVFGQVTITHWNFNSGNTGTATAQWPSPIANASGSGTLSHDLTTTEAFAGSTLNAIGADVSGNALCPTGDGNNGKSLVFSVSTLGYVDIVFSYATRGTSTGFNTHTIDYSSDGTNFTNVSTITGRNVTSFSIQTVDLSAISEVENNPDFKLRITISGASNATGNNRFDNVKLTGVLPLNDGDGTASISNATAGILTGKDIFSANTLTSVDVLINGTSTGTLTSASVTVPTSWGTISESNVALSGTGFSSATFSVLSNVITISSATLTNTTTGTVQLTGLSTPNPASSTDNGNYSFSVKTAKSGGTLTSIANSPVAFVIIPISSIRDETGGIPNDLNSYVAVQGTVSVQSGKLSTTNTETFIQDATGGVNIFKIGLTNMKIDTSYIVKGQVIQFSGLTEISPASGTDIIEVGASTPVVESIQTASLLNSNGPTFEGSLVGIKNVTLISGTWPLIATDATLSFQDEFSTPFTVYIDGNGDIDGSSEPIWPKDLRGVWVEKSSGLGLLVRSLTDIYDANTLPVELSSFTVSASGKNALLKWETTTETNNAGFEVLRNGQSVGFVSGKGTTTEKQSYLFTDKNVSGKVSYQLKQVDTDGKTTFPRYFLLLQLLFLSKLPETIQIRLTL
ncbi:MAG: hypothetical protein J0L62_10890, partial [Bacteroidetes bacterium]|nr:hypothetical protein [Bacteroidota bacterium]